MTEAVIVAIITGVCAILGAYIGQSVAGAKATTNMINELKRHAEVSDAEIMGEINVIKTEITGLRKEVEKHNGVIERTFVLEKRMEVAEEKQKVCNHRISDLEARNNGQ